MRTVAKAGLGVAVLLAAAPLRAHVAPDEHDSALSYLTAWDPLGAVLLALLGYLYLRGQLRLRAHSAATGQRMHAAFMFWGGWGALAAALSPPLESLTGVSFAAHMVQHEILMLVAAPLLVLARPHGILIWGFPDALARGAARMTASRRVRRTAALACAPLTAWLLHAVVLWTWHVPSAFQATLVSDPLHWLQHASFFLVAVIFWYSVLAPGPQSDRAGAAFLSVFTTAVHTSVLGALLTFSAALWYPAYAGYAGFTALEDQQLGGLIMWVPGGAVFLGVGIAIAARWLTSIEKRQSVA